jgi:hypothetical protein
MHQTDNLQRFAESISEDMRSLRESGSVTIIDRENKKIIHKFPRIDTDWTIEGPQVDELLAKADASNLQQYIDTHEIISWQASSGSADPAHWPDASVEVIEPKKKRKRIIK